MGRRTTEQSVSPPRSSDTNKPSRCIVIDREVPDPRETLGTQFGRRGIFNSLLYVPLFLNELLLGDSQLKSRHRDPRCYPRPSGVPVVVHRSVLVVSTAPRLGEDAASKRPSG